MLVVTSIIVLVLGIGVAVMTGVFRESSRATTRATLQQMQQVMDAYREVQPNLSLSSTGLTARSDEFVDLARQLETTDSMIKTLDVAAREQLSASSNTILDGWGNSIGLVNDTFISRGENGTFETGTGNITPRTATNSGGLVLQGDDLTAYAEAN
jgi:type II secretory pathway pseudopilin PulG